MEERWEGWRWSCWNTISFEFKHWGQEIANFKQRYLKVSHRPMQEDEEGVRDPIMCVTCDAICVRDGLSENRKYLLCFLLKTSGSSLLTSPIPFLTAHHTEVYPPLWALLCYPITQEIEPERKLNQTYFHSTYPFLLIPLSGYRRHRKGSYWLSSGCPVLQTKISWLEYSEMGLTGVSESREGLKSGPP